MARSSVDKSHSIAKVTESVVFPGLNSCLKFYNFFWCLAVMWFCTDLVLLFKNWEKRARESSETKVDSSRRLSAMMRLVDRICSWSKSGSNITKHAWTHHHKFNFDDCKILDKATYRHRTTLESWHTATTLNSDNAQHLPEQYRFLLKK